MASRRVGVFALSLLLWGATQAVLPRALAETPARPPAEAGPGTEDEQARAFFEVGAQAYERGRYVEAIDAFENAYQRAPRPGLLFSIAQAHRRAFIASGDTADLASAVEHYRAYLASPSELPRRRDAALSLQSLTRLARSAARAEVDEGAKDSSRLMVSSTTPGAAVQIDGGERVTTLPHVATIAPGKHEVTLSASGYASQTRRILVPASASYALDLALQPLPGSLSLTGLAGSEVWLDGRLVAGLPVARLRVSAGPHQLVVRKQGKLSYERLIRVAPEQDTPIHIPLSNTLQRKASHVVLTGSGASVLGAGVLTLFAYHEQGVAKRWANTLRERPLLASELAAYDRAAQSRDRYRTAAVATGLAGATLAVAAALLMGFDSPPFPSAPAPAGEIRQNEPDVEALPGFDSSCISLQLRGQL